MNLTNIQLDQQKKILIVIICALIVYVDFNFILKAQIAANASLNPKLSGLKSQLASINRDLEKMRLTQGKQAPVTTKVATKSSQIIPEGQISGLLQDISSQANKFDINIVQIRPIRESSNNKPVSGQDKFMPLSVQLDLICDYHNLGKFINALENSLVFMGVQELKISTQLPDYLKQRVSLMLKTYVTK